MLCQLALTLIVVSRARSHTFTMGSPLLVLMIMIRSALTNWDGGKCGIVVLKQFNEKKCLIYTLTM